LVWNAHNFTENLGRRVKALVDIRLVLIIRADHATLASRSRPQPSATGNFEFVLFINKLFINKNLFCARGEQLSVF
jgi:hypothetical protein